MSDKNGQVTLDGITYDDDEVMRFNAMMSKSLRAKVRKMAAADDLSMSEYVRRELWRLYHKHQTQYS